ncbi:trifunctional fatty acid synthase subunit FAS2 [Sugiyamaella lignohabitans]|uniref:Fatty acid synthase subunit alpha n=1 Tax=Sugiyamaella lignohabitans TaxID=796027 RepID=A0A161HHZ5_9ASCO|nr:trifunctional fatty acid synthase subunit FAS2 [Sugiyamaella lignohabitans]ANB11937.1 trifunctional fatty acid synthase subunit FAS2 [Sugiyamaella lignohabitans]
MATRTLKSKYESYDAALSLQRQVLCYSKDTKEIYYTPDPVEPAESESTPASGDAPAAAAPAAVAAAPVAAAAAAGPAASVEDTPVKAVEVLHALVAQKIKKTLDQVPLSKAVKDLVGGKSTVQNEILGDLGKEFGSTPEKPEETPLGELAEQFQDSFSGQLGKQSSSLVSRLISSKMPGGFNITSARKYLNTRWGLGPGRQDSVFLVAITLEPKNRLGDEAAAKAFLDDVTTKYASIAGVNLSSASAAGGAAAGGAGGAVIDSAAFEELTKDQRYLVQQQLELFARYLKVDLRDGDKAFVAQKEATALLQQELDLWYSEHGDFYASGIKPVFSPLKARVYDSYWNWARQDCLTMFYDIIFGRLSNVDREIVSRCISIMNRTNPTLIDFMQYYIDHVPTDRGATYELAQELAQKLLQNCKEAVDADPVYKDVNYPTGPKTTVDSNGNISYAEVPRPAVRKLEQYVQDMAAGGEMTKDPAAGSHTRAELAKIYKRISSAADGKSSGKLKLDALYADLIKAIDTVEAESSPKKALDTVSAKHMREETIPFLHLKKKSGEIWDFDRDLSATYLDGLEVAARDGLTFANKNVLITGAGAGSIGADILQGLISGGAKVVVTTSRYSREVTEYYQSIYTKFGASGSTLIVVPFNQASSSDVRALVDYIYNDTKKGGLGWDLDFVIPFAAIPENGIELDGIDSKSELAHRLMLTNLLRLLGSIKSHKAANGFETRPAQVILPMSPNHGTFGADGLYSESKLSLETLFNRWYSESWSSYLTICGAVIGWTRGTGLMSQNNIIAEGVESLGVRTFSQKEMAFNILGLMTPTIVNICQQQPVWADLNGGLQFVENLKDVTGKLRKELVDSSELRRAVSVETAIEHKVVNGPDADLPYQKAIVKPRANHKFEFPKLKSYEELRKIAPELEGILDLEKVVVATGFSEVGPWGNSRTRWDMEINGAFSLEGAIEMAWIMGLIKHHSGPLKGKPYTGWVDTKTNEPVDDKDVKSKYESYILEHSGIRLIEPELFHGYDPLKKQLLQEIIVEHDLEPFEASKEAADQFKLEQGNKVEVFEIPESGQYTVRFLKGAKIYIPKALKFDRLVAGQIPTGWDARRYGIGEDIISQVDPITLYVLVSTVEALLSAGITDPYEFYKYVHLSEVGNCSGSGMGGVTALRGMFKDRYLDRPVQNDILQESFINTMSAWVNMLLLSSSGPIKTPVGACATAIESVDSGIELIESGKAKIVIVGGYDDFQEEGSHEFGNMNATSNSLTEFEHGRTPKEMSRPNSTSRSGFMESQGAGIQILMNAKLAIDMGVPIYGIVALTSTASDKIGRSVPAPGKGIMTTARENISDLKFPYRLLDVKYRKRQIESRRAQIKQWTESEFEYLQDEFEAIKATTSAADAEAFFKERSQQIENEARRQEKEALGTWGNNFYKSDPRIAPIRGALATYNLTIDDIGVSSFHGTSTKANDKNESGAINGMLNHLGRSKGNPVLGVFQKYLTGHPKGAAGAWMLNGVMQILNSGTVPGNPNADNIDAQMEGFDKIVYPSVTLQTYGVKAATVTSFGFGQKGAIAVVIHPDYVLATLNKKAYETYAAKVGTRYNKAYRYLHNAIAENSMFVSKSKAPYTDEQEMSVYLNPLARVSYDKKSESLIFNAKKLEQANPTQSSGHTEAVLKQLAANSLSGGAGNIGVDVQSLSGVNVENETFLERNFTDAERQYCAKSADPLSSYTGTWSAKEAVFKSLGVKSQGAGASLKSIEVLRDAKGAPVVTLHGEAKAAADAAGVKNVKVSISHDEFQAVAVAVSEK